MRISKGVHMKRFLSVFHALVLAILIPALAFPASFFWKASLAELNAVSATNGDRGIVITDAGVTTFYYRTGGAWVAAGSMNGDEVVVSSAVSITTDTTITDAVRVVPGGSYAISSGKVLTFTGPFEAGNYLIFTGLGSVKFSSPTSISPISSIKSAWWGD